ncbi:MAG: nucleotidyltransferase family protein [Methyloceanibacter sp.]|uniref:nucleotidyltransferase family protein n=1 Tax=Methyloceanibacter sp. TaxID=1965321 RepID=UPI003D6CAE58
MIKIASIVLAAGRSARMAPRNKLVEPVLVEPVSGEPMIRRVVATVLESGVRPVIAVTGFEAGRITQALNRLDVAIVTNPDYADGLSASLRTGLEAVPPDADGALISLGDMPEIEIPVIRALMAEFKGRGAICVPVHRGRRGNPVLWGRDYFPEMMKLTGDSGAKPLVARHAAHLVEVDVATDSIFHDIDTPADLARLNQPGAGR